LEIEMTTQSLVLTEEQADVLRLALRDAADKWAQFAFACEETHQENGPIPVMAQAFRRQQVLAVDLIHSLV
jgi:hypothetical protein